MQDPNKTSVVRAGATRASQHVAVGGERYFAVEVIELNLCRDRLPLLRDINLTVPQGETLALLGPNGAGKSTLLKCLAGALRPTCGSIRWAGHSVARSPMVRRQIGFVGHDCGLYRELTAAENLLFAGRMYGVERPLDKARKLLLEAGLESVAHRAAGELSQGMCRRLAIARVLMHEPCLVLLDEPFASLDADGRHWLEQLLKKWRRESRTVCFASHDDCHSRVLADRIVRLHRGQVAVCETGILSSSLAVLRSA